MFEIAWSKLMLIGVIALIVIGPKDLPVVLRTAGQFLGKLRRMADEFRGQFNDAIRESEFHEFKKGMDDLGESVRSATATNFDPIDSIRSEIKNVVEERKTLGATDPTGNDPGVVEAGESVPPPDLAKLPLPETPMPLSSADFAPPPAEAADAPAAEAPAKLPRKRRSKTGGAEPA